MAFISIKKFLNRYFASEYGSFRGFLRAKRYSLFYHLGLYDKYKNINWKNVKRLVFVCKGNICRSAFAEAVAKSLAMDVASFGISTIDNSPADNNAIYHAQKKGFRLDNHMTTSFTTFQRKPGDLYIAMEPSHLSALKQKNLSNAPPVTLAGLWCAKARPYIEDPYGKSPDYFENCFSCIVEVVHTIKAELQKFTNPI